MSILKENRLNVNWLVDHSTQFYYLNKLFEWNEMTVNISHCRISMLIKTRKCHDRDLTMTPALVRISLFSKFACSVYRHMSLHHFTPVRTWKWNDERHGRGGSRICNTIIIQIKAFYLYMWDDSKASFDPLANISHFTSKL